MARTTVHRGAIPTKLAGEGDDQCESKISGTIALMPTPWNLRCVYRAGHEGPHYCAGEIWGNTHVDQD